MTPNLTWLTRGKIRRKKLSQEFSKNNGELFTTPFFFFILTCEAVTLAREEVVSEKKSTFDALRHVAVSHDPRFLHRIARDLRQHSVRRDETVLDGGDNLILVRAVLEL